MDKEFQTYTSALLEYNDRFLDIFEQTRENNEDGGFFSDVKPFVEEVKTMNDKWRQAAIDNASLMNSLGFSTRQIDMVHEHIERLSVQAFYVKTSRSNFINANRTVKYTLNTLAEKLGSTK